MIVRTTPQGHRLLLSSVAVVLLGPHSPGPALAASIHASHTIKVASVRFYSGKNFRFVGCYILGSSASTFPNTTKRIYNYVSYADWEGRHTDRDYWYSPDGKLYQHSDLYAHTASGPSADCGQLKVAGDKASKLLGSWTYKLVVDGKVVVTKTFTITRPLPSPRGHIVVSSVRFYSGRRFRYADCTPTGPPSSRFPGTTKRIHVLVTYAQWEGRHADQDRWYSPDGRLYFRSNTITYSGHGRSKDCGYFHVAGTRASRMLGKWTYQLRADGQVAALASFWLVKR